MKSPISPFVRQQTLHISSPGLRHLADCKTSLPPQKKKAVVLTLRLKVSAEHLREQSDERSPRERGREQPLLCGEGWPTRGTVRVAAGAAVRSHLAKVLPLLRRGTRQRGPAASRPSQPAVGASADAWSTLPERRGC